MSLIRQGLKNALGKCLLPDLEIERLTDLNLADLKSRGIGLLILDVDNTLASLDESADEQGVRMVNRLRQEGFEVVLLSNNFSARARKTSSLLGVEGIYFACKPLKRGYRKIMKRYDLPAERIAAVGDQLLTDILGARRNGHYAIRMQARAGRKRPDQIGVAFLEEKLYRYLKS